MKHLLSKYGMYLIETYVQVTKLAIFVLAIIGQWFWVLVLLIGIIILRNYSENIPTDNGLPEVKND